MDHSPKCERSNSKAFRENIQKKNLHDLGVSKGFWNGALTMTSTNPKKSLINWAAFKLKSYFYLKKLKGENATYRIGESIYNTYVWGRTWIQYTTLTIRTDRW